MKIDRLLAMTVLMLNRGRISAKELAERFEVTTKTVYRDMETLSRAGIPVVAHQGVSGGFEIMEPYTLARQLVSLKEISSLLAAVKGVSTALDDQTYANLAEKVEGLLLRTDTADWERRKDDLVFDFHPWGQGAAAKNKVSALKGAIEDGRRAAITYVNTNGTETERIVEPAALILKGSVWYLHAYCTLRKEFRIFRLSRIADLSVLSQASEPREVPPLEGYSWNSEWLAHKEVEMTLHFRAEVRHRVGDAFPPGLVNLLPDGSLCVQGVFALDEWFYGMLLSFGDSLKIEHPPSLAGEIRERARKILLRYEN
ncbi:Predicted DNA-binding transcriptional regulator YafY, contains an HTH and WYL domains [Paenibacillus sp. UNC499MF]|nr:Predicted DNA-binding transcriptional regulator YafY, contains an HTH and WYL domains [Paenibacillus sp. UNC499MF]